MKPPFSSLVNNGAIWWAEQQLNPVGADCTIISGGAITNGREVQPFNSLPFGVPEIDNLLPSHGLPAGSTNEWSTDGDFIPLAFFVHLANQVSESGRCIVWIERSLWPLPQYLSSTSNNITLLERSYFIDVPSKEEKLWLIDQSVRTKSVGLIICQIESFSVAILKRLSIAAKHSGAILLYFKKSLSKSKLSNFTDATPLTRWKVNFVNSNDSYPHFSLKLSSYKGFGTDCGEWRIRFNSSKAEFVTNSLVTNSLVTNSLESEKSRENISFNQHRNYEKVSSTLSTGARVKAS